MHVGGGVCDGGEVVRSATRWHLHVGVGACTHVGVGAVGVCLPVMV